MHIMLQSTKLLGTVPIVSCLAGIPVDAFMGNRPIVNKYRNYSGYVKKLQNRMHFAYKLAARTAEKVGRRYKVHYDIKKEFSIEG